MDSSTSLFVAIPAYQESDSLQRTIEFFRRRTAGVHVIQPFVMTQSVVANKNMLLEAARLSNASYVAISDDDVEPEPGWDEQIIGAMQRVTAESGRRVGQAAPRMILPDGRIFSLWANVHLQSDPSKSWVKPVKFSQPDDAAYRATLFVGAVPGTLSVFSRDALDAMSWRFDDRYLRSQYDDIDQSLECRRLSFEVLYVGDTSIIHHTQQATPRAANENYEKLLQKWSAHPELSLTIEPGAADINEASRYTRGQPPTMTFRVRQVYRDLRRQLLQTSM
jgi:hypothetical protein